MKQIYLNSPPWSNRILKNIQKRRRSSEDPQIRMISLWKEAGLRLLPKRKLRFHLVPREKIEQERNHRQKSFKNKGTDKKRQKWSELKSWPTDSSNLKKLEIDKKKINQGLIRRKTLIWKRKGCDWMTRLKMLERSIKKKFDSSNKKLRWMCKP